MTVQYSVICAYHKFFRYVFRELEISPIIELRTPYISLNPQKLNILQYKCNCQFCVCVYSSIFGFHWYCKLVSLSS